MPTTPQGPKPALRPQETAFYKELNAQPKSTLGTSLPADPTYPLFFLDTVPYTPAISKLLTTPVSAGTPSASDVTLPLSRTPRELRAQSVTAHLAGLPDRTNSALDP